MNRPTRVRATKYEQHDATVLGGVRLRYVDVPSLAESESGPPVVMLHGIASRIEEYEDLIGRIRAKRRVIVMDLPGNGYSDKPERSYSLSFFEDAVLGLLDHLDVKEADLTGGSLGGNLVLRLAHRTPERFRRLAPWAPGGAWEPMRMLGMLTGLWLRSGTTFFWPCVWVQSRFWYDPAWARRDAALQEAFAHYRERSSEKRSCGCTSSSRGSRCSPRSFQSRPRSRSRRFSFGEKGTTRSGWGTA